MQQEILGDCLEEENQSIHYLLQLLGKTKSLKREDKSKSRIQLQSPHDLSRAPRSSLAKGSLSLCHMTPKTPFHNLNKESQGTLPEAWNLSNIELRKMDLRESPFSYT
ncbi:hypothetical protein CFP56_006822 [Quercus suber]|uniref:Uncharacterized protein n=1 Tax=Quercus suber TaxID=58331 RepID=A0AAW0M691_QUESU